MKKLIDLNEASVLLKVKKSWLRMAIFRRKIPFIKVGRLIRFDIEQLNEWLLRNSN